MEHLKLSDGEWKLMKMLWAGSRRRWRSWSQPWTRHRVEPATIFAMLKRLIAKGAVTMDDSGKFQKYSAAITYADVEPEETESFLSKVYGGSVGMMVSNLVGVARCPEQEIQELKAILDAAENRRNPHAERHFDRFRADCSRAAGAGDFQNRVPKRMIYCLWLVVLLKLCLPGRCFLCRFFRRRTELRLCRLCRPAGGFNCIDNSSAVDDRTTTHGSGSNNDAAEQTVTQPETKPETHLDACRSGKTRQSR